MLQWLRKKRAKKPSLPDELVPLIKKVTGSHLCAFLCLCLLGGYKPATLISSGKSSSFKADFISSSNSAATSSEQAQQKKTTTTSIEHPVTTTPVKNTPKKEPAKKKTTTAPVQTTHKIYPPVTPLITKKSEPIKQKETVKIPVAVAPKKSEKTVIPEPEPVKSPEPKPAPVEKEAPLEQEQKNNNQELDIGTINQEQNQSSGLETPADGWQEHPVARIIAEQWHTVKGMPSDFYCELLFIIDKQGKASAITVLSAHKSRIYQAHAQETLMRCTFDTKYSNKKCRIILRI